MHRLPIIIALAAGLGPAESIPRMLAQAPAEEISLPRIGLIEFYGRRTIGEARLLSALGLKPGDALPPSREDLEARLLAVPGVVAASSEVTCCLDVMQNGAKDRAQDGANAVLYVGIEERGAPHLEYHTPPSGDAADALMLPDDIHREYEGFLASVAMAVRVGKTDEDLSAGYSLMTHTGARVHQLRFVELAEQYFSDLRQVLRGSSDNEQRAIAAYVLGYGPDKAAAADDLQWAIRDSDPTVRNNAMRALAALAVYAAKQPDAGRPTAKLKVPATWFIEALNSLDWQDRVTAANILVTLTELRPQAIFDQIRERALTSLIEMANWKTLAQALPAFLVAGRMAGLSEANIEAQWSAGKRDEVLARLTVRKPVEKKK